MQGNNHLIGTMVDCAEALFSPLNFVLIKEARVQAKSRASTTRIDPQDGALPED